MQLFGVVFILEAKCGKKILLNIKQSKNENQNYHYHFFYIFTKS